MRSRIAILVRAALCFGGLLAVSPSSVAQSLDKPKPVIADGASFSEPDGWVRLTPDKAKTKGWFISPDSDRRAPVLMIMVDTGKPTDPSLRGAAEGLARDWGSRVLDERTTLDGTEALRVRVEKPGRGLRPVEGVVAMKDGRLYLLMGGSVPGRKVSDQVEEVRKGWKWVR